MSRTSRAALSLRDLLAVDELQLGVSPRSVASLDRPVTWAFTTEIADPAPHIRRHELLCTVGTPLTTPADSARLVGAVHAAGAAGICLGIGEIHTSPPEPLIAECNRLDVPLIEMAFNAPFLAINDVLVEHKLSLQPGGDQHGPGILAALLDAARTGSSAEQLIVTATRLVGGSFHRFTGTPARSEPAAGRRDEQAASLSVPCGAHGVLGWTGPPGELDVETLDQIAGILQIADRARHDELIHQRQRLGQLFSLVADGLAHPVALSAELEAAGQVAATVVVSAWPSGTAERLHSCAPDLAIADSQETVYVVAPTREVVHRCAESTRLVCGYSSQVDRHDLARGISEARATLMLARRRGTVVGPDELTTLHALLEQQPVGRLAPFIDQLISPLLSAETRGGCELLDTLRGFLGNGSAQSTADQGYLHVNTVRHRLKRIHDLTGRNPLSPQDQVDLKIAVWAHDRLAQPAGILRRGRRGARVSVRGPTTVNQQ